jgi:flavin reductase (DIM6/NTAB) family NADH-FMN oxidoreductase RutF/DNA-binding GntR family transcriptional regulator
MVDSREFRDVVGHLASGVTVVTATADGRDFGITASSVTSLSLDPPSMLVCLKTGVPTSVAVRESGHYTVNVLGRGQELLAARFAAPQDDKFAGVVTTRGSLGAPLLTDALAHIECRVVEQVESSTHTIYLGEAVRAVARDGEPLTYFRGGFGRFEFARDDAAYRKARELVLHRQYPPDSVLDPGDLGFDIAADEAAAVYALTRLTSDGLVERDPHRGYVVVPLDVRLSDETFDARCAIEIGAVDTSLVEAQDQQVAPLRAAFDGMAAQLVGGRFVDFDKYLDANFAFHQGVVMLSGNRALQNAFGQLGIKAVMTRSFGSTRVSSQQFVDVQGQMLAGIEARDPVATRAAILTYRDIAKDRVRVILSQTGGRL